MSRLDEIAEGIVMVLATQSDPRPLKISLWNERPIDATFLVRAVVDSCQRQGLTINHISICPELGGDLLKQYGDDAGYSGVRILSSANRNSEIEIYRFPVNDVC